MHEHQAGGSTQNKPSSSSQRRPAGRAALCFLTASVIAGCAMIPADTGVPVAAAPALLTSPLASAAIGDPAAIAAAIESLPTARVATPEIVLDPVPVPAIDLVERLRAGFVLANTDDPAMQRELEYYAKHPDYIDRVFTRGSRYLHHIAEELERRGMPADLALLPIVESAFDPFAYSHGRAAGLWQIIPGTATHLGVKQNWWFDGRRDVLESTRAALDYLEALHARFDGDWLLAVAGYNSGEGNVSRALKRAEAAGKPKDFWGIRSYLPRETRTYVPRLLAIRNLVAAPEVHDITIPAIEDAPYFAVVETDGQIDMALAADLAGLDTEQLYELNAGVNRWATDPDGPHRILVPIDHAERFAAALEGLGERQRVQWSRHQIRSGDSLIALANRYQTTVAVLREVNELRSNTIRAGDYLMIPHAVGPTSAYTLSADARLASTQNRERSGERVVHVVRGGESLWTISRRYGVEVRSLAAWNGMAPGDTLSVGRELVVWASTAVAATSGGGLTSIAAVTGGFGGASPSQMRRVNYVVRQGDSLSSIAARFRVSLNELLEWNESLATRRYLQPGQRVTINVNVTEQST